MYTSNGEYMPIYARDAPNVNAKLQNYRYKLVPRSFPPDFEAQERLGR